MNKFLTVLALVLATCLLFIGCSNDGSNSEGENESTEPVIRQIAGNSALGRPGSWSANCLDENCARADADGDYLLATEVAQSGLMSSDIPEEDGTNSLLFSRYRLDDSITTSLVNVNPSTHAVLDIWSNVNQNQSVNLCAEDETCESALLESFTQSVEDTIVSQLDTLLGDAWPAGRSPFSDIYVADSSDPLDVMHDYLQFVVTDTEFIVFDNQGTELIRTPLVRLTQSLSLDGFELTSTQFESAQQFPPDIPSENVITLSVRTSPSQPTEAPASVSVDASRSTSLNGTLTFAHELTLANGTTQPFSGDNITTTINEGGNHIWVVTATDTSGASRTQGFIIPLTTSEQETPRYGGDGSCVTPESALDANTQNLCEEAQNGSTLGQCDVLSSSSVTLVQSPAPCAAQIQNGGDLIGVCTVTLNEVRLFHYVNPMRPNNVEDFADKQTRVGQQCTDIFEGEWSTTP